MFISDEVGNERIVRVRMTCLCKCIPRLESSVENSTITQSSLGSYASQPTRSGGGSGSWSSVTSADDGDDDDDDDDDDDEDDDEREVDDTTVASVSARPTQLSRLLGKITSASTQKSINRGGIIDSVVFLKLTWSTVISSSTSNIDNSDLDPDVVEEEILRKMLCRSS